VISTRGLKPPLYIESRNALASLKRLGQEDEMGLIRLFIVVVILAIVGAWLSGNLGGPTWSTFAGTDRRSTSEAISRARERSVELGAKARDAIAASKAGETLNEAALTAKIKAKMALDNVVKARAIDVTTQNTEVTLNGTVQSSAERERALMLARETDGVTRVIDELQMR
jgi:osmotically-inducible protein OsmY